MQGKLIDKNCNVCGKQLNTWDAKCSKALAYKNLVCEKCIAKEYGITTDELRDKLENFFGVRPCMGI
ncbi:hypothetical protein HZF24_06935 [Sedimentibacter hydroxybenzoicus DSM 7310]|uniref:Uncharacterized protein n=1 Tax=Sedimentibacter hydroxybenzoicus DSM 7310 TaxID=1123245 RepID=A0A974BIT8_SEDHY|nr:hypothetical protein [Sedimentibacter hydroxybenzoicus]NYB73873.1 hypothetical protein [Sedimentibacter hydroxybenzoicus DSM 7310]